MRYLLFIFASLAASNANTQECQEITHTFSSGANWRVCANVSDTYGLSLSAMHYFAPGDAPRQVLQALHPAQILYAQNGTSSSEFLLGEASQHVSVLLDGNTCDGDRIAISGDKNVCTVVRPLPILAKYGTRQALHGEAIDIYSASAHESIIWRNNVRLTEDGRIIPSLSLSGLRRPVSAGEDGTATIQITWRMAFSLNSEGRDDRIEQFDFPLNRIAGNRREMHVRPIDTEALLSVARDDFRAWRVVDQTGAGYYLDPQNSGYQTVSSAYNWAKFDLAVTAFNDCERLAYNNPTQNCAAGLDDFTDGESLADRALVLWYTQSRIYRPRSEDNPVISSLHSEFELLPFEWTASSPFESLD